MYSTVEYLKHLMYKLDMGWFQNNFYYKTYYKFPEYFETNVI